MIPFFVATAMTALLADGRESPGPAEVPTMTVAIHSAPSIPPVIVDQTLEEAAAVWRPTGVTFRWHPEPVRDAPRTARPRVIIADERGQPTPGGSPVGWVMFNGSEPDGDIHLSHANAGTLLDLERRDRAGGHPFTPAERHLLMGRMLGRALAHEIGHYLLRSRAHARRGLMRARRTLREFIAPHRRDFDVDAAVRAAAVRRIWGLSIS
jgi:hypothetical protein